MKIFARNKLNFSKCIDIKYGPETSIVLRYRNALRSENTEKEDSQYKGWLQKTSIREGARIFPLLSYREVEIYILDETSLMQTKTLKSIDGCVTIAKCKSRGYKKVIFESGGNTGTALTEYGRKEGLETYFLVPEENIPLLNSKVFESDTAHLIAVKEPGLVKEAAQVLGKLNGLKHIPQTAWRYEASMFRGFFIVEYMLEENKKFDWVTQTISAAFGPIGIYRVLKRFEKETGGVPQFLGIQQEANCPLYRTWKAKTTTIAEREIHSTSQLLTRVMYDEKPHTYGTCRGLINILESTGGDLSTVNHAEFSEFLEHDFDGQGILDLLKANGIEITLRDGEVVEKTGLIALAGTFKAIAENKIAQGSKVLCCLTSGISEADSKANPEYRLSGLKDIKYEKL